MRGWPYRGARLLTCVLICVLAVSLLSQVRSRWVQPLPRVKTGMGRPFRTEAHFGSRSAYRLLLQAAEAPVGGIGEPTANGVVWQEGWDSIWLKFRTHGWPPGTDGLSERPAAPVRVADVDGIPAVSAWTVAEYRDVERLLKLYEPKFRLAHDAVAAANPQVPTPDSPDFSLAYLRSVLRLGDALEVSAYRKAASGDYEAALHELLLCIRVGQVVSRGGGAANHVADARLSGQACRAIWEITVDARLSTTNSLRQGAAALLDCASTREPFAEAIRVELLTFLACADTVYEQGVAIAMPDARGIPQTKLGLSAAGSTRGSTRSNIQSVFQHLVGLAELPWRSDTEWKWRSFLGSLGGKSVGKVRFLTEDPVGQQIAARLIPPFYLDHKRSAVCDAMLRCTAVFLALKSHEARHSSLPEHLELLVPESIRKIPVDPFDGKPLRYVRDGVPNLDAHKWVVYSIGPNCIDEKGTATEAANILGTQGYNADLVWPSARYKVKQEARDR